MNKFTRCWALWFVTLAAGLGRPQTVPSEFEAASVKLEASAKGIVRPVMTGGPGTNSPGRFRCSHVTLMSLIIKAYGLLPDQVVGPDWLTVERYSVDAIVPQAVAKQGFSRMLQSLLVQRFSLITASDRRVFAVYRLVIAKGGSKLRPSPGAEPEEQGVEEDPDVPPVQTGIDKNGCPQFAPGSHGAIGSMGGNNCMTYRRCSMPLFVQRLALMAAMETGSYFEFPSPLHIIDQTGLRGEFDFELKYAIPFRPPGFEPSEDTSAMIGTGQSIFQAIESQLGLKLEKSSAQLPVLLVKQAVRTPSGN